MKTIIEIDISDIYVEDGIFSFDYVVTYNGKKRKKESYDSDYDTHTARAFKKILEDHYAVTLVLERISEE